MKENHYENDKIFVNLSVSDVIKNDTVRVNAYIVAQVEINETIEEFNSKIKRLMTSFINADWSFTNTVREKDNTGYEKVTLQATARINEKENYSLEDRADAVSVKGLRITDISVDTSTPFKLIKDLEKKLRLELLVEANNEAFNITKLLNRPYRVGNVQFVDNSMRSMKSVSNSYSNSNSRTYSAITDNSDETIGNVHKVTISAQVEYITSFDHTSYPSMKSLQNKSVVEKILANEHDFIK